MTDLSTLRSRLEAIGQGHLFRYFDGLTIDQRVAYLAQLQSLDVDALPGLIETYVTHTPAAEVPADLKPVPYYPFNPAARARAWHRHEAKARGEALVRAGKVAAFVVAGGQGSRLGFDGPKGCFPAGAVTGKTLFQMFAENLLGAKDRYGAVVPWYIMTSPLNHDATVAFFKAHAYFGLNADDVMFFPQGVMPSLDLATGRVLLASKGEIATNPDGHGGCVRALHVSGALADMRRRGIEHLSYFQVDNPHARVIDPAFLGLHAGAEDSSGEMSSKMVVKASPDEKVGVFCLAGGKVRVVEYSDMPAALTTARNPDGSLTFNAGSIAIHAIGVEFLERLATDPRFALPFHRAEKKVPCINPETGQPVTPTANNAVKLEKFVFDALALARASIVYETDRLEEFAPIKNATGVDSVETSKVLQTKRAARWLQACGVDVPMTPAGEPDCVIEISPRTATSVVELRAAMLPTAVERGSRIAL
ncbi:MAG: UDP-N-acetylhexosamine pyrophosphorylase [Phycisphaerae bacterium]|nr:MAG: UDP-N-acetylhexosamine pyrophosphorylase [Phycisphaerae bacterium]